MLEFARGYGLKRQAPEASGSSTHNIAESFDFDTNVEFVRFLRDAKRLYTEVQSKLEESVRLSMGLSNILRITKKAK
ncbi:MAG: hypothetical protein DCC43_10130 [Candidatus Brocadia sp.]|jgi:four helix bundle protein|nr:hypothetical protein [Candidatus Brocadia fulgida]MCC6325121.1 four helix bundle protein [Candidatus Brocadia sp.]MCE7910473.1 four helix bundle protein [Candidatus Brocadia sp. AMX3]OQY97354.1 MAG: hypothetical protein B6D35_15240 [Candidatus Brocadia sp. UTAMX2]MDG5995426.1 four helix bundle protein [Candidatus Brocadia sp.]